MSKKPAATVDVLALEQRVKDLEARPVSASAIGPIDSAGVSDIMNALAEKLRPVVGVTSAALKRC
jgi:hypothetical protein